jgi:cell division protein FtsB
VPVVLAALVAVFILVVGFPASTLWTQHGQLAAASAQLTELQHQNRVLTEQEHQLSSSAEIARLAREDYQLIPQGQTLFDILPPAGTAGSTPDGTTTGDPADQPLVAPSDAPSMSPDPGLPSNIAATSEKDSGGGSNSGPGGSSAPGTSSSFWSRVSNTLEFWK